MSEHRGSGRDATQGAAGVRAAGVERWVDAGLITEDQARAIKAYEQARASTRPSPHLSPALEALAYVGGTLLAVGGGMLVGQFWDDLGVWGRLAVLVVSALLTGAVGATVGESEPVTWRLRGFLWALSTVAIAAAAGIFAFEVLDARGEPVALMAAGAGAAASGAYRSLRDRPLQHVGTFVGLAVAIGVTILWAEGTGGHGGSIGLALWLFGAAWAGLAWRRRVPPPVVGFLLGVVLTLIAPAFVGAQVQWLAPLLGLATAAAWMGVGVVRGERAALAPGAVGVFVFLPWTLGYYFGETFGAPVIAMVSGVLLLVIVLLLVRRGRGGIRGGAWGAHFRSRGHDPVRGRSRASEVRPAR
ncbi:MAG: DUF2157 domain-containing protein [Acidimicrobiia bacterium]